MVISLHSCLCRSSAINMIYAPAPVATDLNRCNLVYLFSLLILSFSLSSDDTGPALQRTVARLYSQSHRGQPEGESRRRCPAPLLTYRLPYPIVSYTPNVLPIVTYIPLVYVYVYVYSTTSAFFLPHSVATDRTEKLHLHTGYNSV